MKNILVVGTELTDFLKALERIQSKETTDVKVISCTYDEFSCDISTESQKVFFRNEPLDVHGIYFRSFSKHFFIASTLALYCERNAIPFNNTSTTSRVSNGKLFQGLAFIYANLPTPRTLFFHRTQILTEKTKTYVEKNLQYPIIVKSIAGTEGKDNYLAQSWIDVEKIMHESAPDIQYIFQECIPNDSDHRLLTLNHIVKVAYKRVRDDKTSHLNNVSQGAHTEAVELSAISHLIPLAEAASRIVQKEVCGVDIMINSDTGKPFILEANPCPGLSAAGTLEAVFSYLQDLGTKTFPPIHTAEPNSVQNYAQRIKDYFIENSDSVGSEYFHFLSRLYLWTHDASYKTLLSENGMDKMYANSETFSLQLKSILEEDLIPKDITDPIRKNFYKKFPTVPYVARILSLTRHAYTVFYNDFRSEVYKIYSDEELAKLCKDILNDPSALYVFSSNSDTTNILFDYYHFMKDASKAFDPIALGENALKYVTNPTVQTLNSSTYFIMHMVMGESRYYSKPLSPETIAGYTSLFQKLEALISKHFFSYKLDVKLEFLVCARILNYTSYLESMIYSEALNSKSPYGDFIVDTYNVTAEWQKKDLKNAEHRNILFILSTLPYVHATKPGSKESR